MNHAALLALIADLYTQVASLSADLAAAREEIEILRTPATGPNEPGAPEKAR